MPYITAADILDHAKVGSPSAADTAWSETVAAAIEALIAHEMTGVTVASPSDAEAELIRAALDDGAAAYARRNAPHGVLSIGPDGQVARLGSDLALALRPVFRRYGTPGIG